MESQDSSSDSDESDPTRMGDDFSTLGIHELILKWLYSNNLRHMTRVQSLSINTFLKKGNDVLVQSCTGSGKTLCFNLLDVYSVIVLPTRELATQVFEIIVDALVYIENEGRVEKPRAKIKHTFKIMERNLYCSLIIGGTTVENDVKFLSNAKEREYVKCFIVATPGRLSHLMDKLEHERVWTFKNLGFVILDEADRFLEMGYQNDMSKIFRHLPKQRKTGLFSATLTSGVQTLSKLCLSNQIFINADDLSQNYVSSLSNEVANATNYTTPKGLNNYYLILSTEQKLHFALVFIEYLRKAGATKLVLFFLSCDLVDYYYEVITRLSSTANPLKYKDKAKGKTSVNYYRIHRKLTTKKRNKNINMFKSDSGGSLSVLLCTDIFSRGIDIPRIDWILQIGRAGRADSVGNALLLLTETEESYIQFQINRKIELTRIPPYILDEVKDICSSTGNSDKNGTGLPYVLYADKLEDKAGGSSTYLEHLKSNPVVNPVLPWERTSFILACLRAMNSTNRDILLSSSRAFVSYTRAYSEHSLKYIFEKHKLDYGSLATSLGVLRIPRVKEILGKNISHFLQSSVNPRDVPFLDAEKESRRLKELSEHVPERRKPAKKEPEKSKRTRSEKRKAKRNNTYEEWNEFRREEALVKKLKRKKFDPKNVEKLLNNEELSEAGEDVDLTDSKSLKRWILRGKGRKKRR
ncbi:ATP-dependent RNA helicase [Theileria orientalis strain Shintoku]|uniref:ATP-dependent RNA helicase n=1 Tax=Theileria orientalis strain Shintoku TaxID=869250 RepID=J4C847_THEOR|nr:ATP-dependent RNA helicase [Theileria orientalis strain Shintoku]BAM40158.1 ATP-dependent RNA helicase [Theileria orientalis strain Shintoku]|eukprot:XP_009690459.1 ATP-dependent RNA helicase [Theileria orientalis strain Shintoku]